MSRPDFSAESYGSKPSDKAALALMKERERNLSRKLVSVRLDPRTVVTTTKNRMNQLIQDLTDK